LTRLSPLFTASSSKCQASARERWLGARRRELLPVRYVHVVFTVPRGLVPLASAQQEDLLRSSVSDYCRNPAPAKQFQRRPPIPGVTRKRPQVSSAALRKPGPPSARSLATSVGHLPARGPHPAPSRKAGPVRPAASVLTPKAASGAGCAIPSASAPARAETRVPGTPARLQVHGRNRDASRRTRPKRVRSAPRL
jgi:hypothetical protein